MMTSSSFSFLLHRHHSHFKKSSSSSDYHKADTASAAIIILINCVHYRSRCLRSTCSNLVIIKRLVFFCNSKDVVDSCVFQTGVSNCLRTRPYAKRLSTNDVYAIYCIQTVPKRNARIICHSIGSWL